jgi:hypothetical protein
LAKTKKILETFVKCPNCRRLKNANHKPKDKEVVKPDKALIEAIKADKEKTIASCCWAEFIFYFYVPIS